MVRHLIRMSVQGREAQLNFKIYGSEELISVERSMNRIIYSADTVLSITDTDLHITNEPCVYISRDC